MWTLFFSRKTFNLLIYDGWNIFRGNAPTFKSLGITVQFFCCIGVSLKLYNIYNSTNKWLILTAKLNTCIQTFETKKTMIT